MTQHPADLESHIGYWLRMVSNAVSQSFARRVEVEGVTVAEWVFLRVLYGAPNISPSTLAEKMGMTRGAISKLAERLIDKALVARQASPEDKRAHTLALTPAGHALVPRLAALADGNDKAFFDALTLEERESLATLLKNIAARHRLTNMLID
jgi:DNA-binding MarR family transcriptional regulator